MLRTTRNLGQLAEELRTDLPGIREELQQVADDARSAFSRVEVAATAATAVLVVTAFVAVTALILATVAVVSARSNPNPVR